jgi:hypothetical protein
MTCSDSLTRLPYVTLPTTLSAVLFAALLIRFIIFESINYTKILKQWVKFSSPLPTPSANQLAAGFRRLSSGIRPFVVRNPPVGRPGLPVGRLPAVFARHQPLRQSV